MAHRKINIKLSPRIHSTLIGMNQGGYRINGGIGFAINNPINYLQVKCSDDFYFKDLRLNGFKSFERERILKLLRDIFNKFNLSQKISIEVSGNIQTHRGFGSSTSIRLGCIEALFMLNNHNIEKDSLIKLSGRGGTSGIGINTYFKGGFIFDLGKKIDKYSFKPSSKSEHRKNLPLLFKYLKLPNWKIGLCIPKNIKSKSENEESSFFNKVCPIKYSEVCNTLYHSVYGLSASIQENNINDFIKSINEIQKTKWKREERNLYGKELLRIERELRSIGAEAVGMSSLGPSLYFIDRDFKKNSKDYISLISDCEIIFSSTTNTGRKIQYE
jgi:beta-ribofuranosylaminobenzene 5'-phosphate synthase